MADGEPRLSVVVSDHEGRPLAARGLSQWLRRVAPIRARGVVHVALVPDAQVRRLNRTYRRMDRATDVLSFPASSPETRASSLQPRASSPQPRASSPQPRARSPFLGDIVIASGVARRQARAAGHSPLTEFKVLALHGLLHLLGYDHERDTGTMFRLERRLRLRGGLREGLIERAGQR